MGVGIHLPDFKEITNKKNIKKLPLAEKYIVPLSQHAGKPAIPIVKVNDKVFKYQKIASADGVISSNIHSPTSGKVVDISYHIHPLLPEKQLSIVISPDGLDSEVSPKKTYEEYFRYDRKDLIQQILECGVVGLGGAQFPTHVKLSPPKEVDKVILNGCECEPFITCDDLLMREHPKEIIRGLRVIMYILDVYEAIVAIENNKKEAIKSMKKVIFDEPNMRLEVLKTRYPQGAEKQLIKTLTGKEVPPGALPYDVGVIVHNVQTAYAIYQAIFLGKPLVERVVTVYHPQNKNSGNYWIKIGTPISHIINSLNIDNFNKIVFGGPMMGVSQTSIDAPVIKGTSAILFLEEKNQQQKYHNCIKCGRCVKNCPMNLLPNFLSMISEKMLWEDAKIYNPKDCIECGICSYVCPAKRPVLTHIKILKLHV